MLSAETEEESPEDETDHSRECGRPEVLKEASLTGRRRIERFSIALDELRSVFEAPKCGGKWTGPAEYTGKEVEIERSLCSPTFKSHPGSQSDDSGKDSDKKGKETPFDKMSPESGHSHNFEVTVDPTKPTEVTAAGNKGVSDLQEVVSLKERMARYQAAVSRSDCHSFSANVMEEAEMCSVPGGLATVKKHFEDEMASSCNAFSQYQHQHQSRSEQEVMLRSQDMKRNEQETSKGHGTDVLKTEMVSHLEKHAEKINKTSQFQQYVQETVIDTPEDEEIPKVSTKLLKEQFEKSAQGKVLYADTETTSPAKQIKIKSEHEATFKPSSAVGTSSASYTSSSQVKETSASTYSECGVSSSKSAQVNATLSRKMEEFPPPPPDTLQTPIDVTAFSQSPEFPSLPSKLPIPKDLYSKQRKLYELNRLYKHIHPELRKNLEKAYISEVSEIVSSQMESGNSATADVQQARYAFENTNDKSQKDLNSDREYLEWNEILKGEVQSIRWIFENQPLDSIHNHSPEPGNVSNNTADHEIIAGSDVKYTTWMFETQPIDTLSIPSSVTEVNAKKIPELAKGDVRTARWMFETKPLDSMNKMHQSQEEGTSMVTKDIVGGDVKTVRYMFETKQLDQLGQLHSVDEVNLLQLRSELKEIKGNVKRSIKCFETQPLYVLRDDFGQMLEIKTVHREDIEKGDVRTARWMFETQPLDTINKEITEIKVVRGISMEENVKGGVSKAKWLFETQPLEKIKEESEEVITEKEKIIGTDVSQKCWMFETQPLDILKEVSEAEPVSPEEIVGGDVQTTKHLFETLPIEAIKDSADVGKLQKITASEEERGDVRHQKWIFETQPLEEIRENKKEYTHTVKLEEVDRGDVRKYTHIFESNNLVKVDASHKIEVEGVTQGSVEWNKSLFETTPLYAIQDHLGQYHQVKTVQQEEILRGDVRSCRWLFETRPIDQFDESLHKFQIIRGISAQEMQAGNVKSAKWLFETQPLDSIKYFNNIEETDSKSEQAIDIVKGDVKTCKWLFETQPMESLYEKVSLMTDREEIHKGDVKTCTWLFETKPLDTIKNDSETTAKLQTVKQEDVHGGDVRTACLLFETENLDSIQGEEGKEIKPPEMDIQAGDVSSMTYKFENQSLDSISSSSAEVLKQIKTLKSEDIQKGNVLNCRWLFENQPLDLIKESQEGDGLVKTVTDIQGGDVRKGCFIFETYSLDEIKKESDYISTKKTITDEAIKGDVKNYRMLFETQPLYAIQDQEGCYHEVTTVKKEEVIHGDVRRTRWLFETKPLDSINESGNVYVIKSVTQEDIQKGDVSSVRYRFETQPLDQISEESHNIVPTVDNIQGGNVKSSKRFFESENGGQNNYIRTVSVNEIQNGSVKTSTWLFETHTMEELRGEGSEYKNVKTVTQEEMQKGDVKQAVWLFENQTLDSIKETDENTTTLTKEEIPLSDVKTTTWLFETTPMHAFSENRIERVEIIGKSIKETLADLYSQKVIESPGIIIEADEVGDVRMAKYKLMNQTSPEIQKEEVIRVDLRNIVMNLLSQRDYIKNKILVSEEEKGNVNLTKSQLLNTSTKFHAEKEEIVRGDVQQAIKNLFSEEKSAKKGIIIQEDERGDINMTIYCLLHENPNDTIKREEVIGGDVKHTIHHLFSSASNSKVSERAKIDTSERGNVQFFTTCIETGALDYLKQLQTGSDEALTTRKLEEEDGIIAGDVEGTKLLLKKRQPQVERTVNETDIIPGDVQNTVKVFMTEPQSTSDLIPKEEIIKGDLKSTLNSLNQAINQKSVAKTEEIIKGDMMATLKSLKESSDRWKESNRQSNVNPPDIEQTIECLEKATNTKTEILKREIIRDDLEISLKSLQEAHRAFKEVNKEGIMKKNVQTGMVGFSERENTKTHQMAKQRDQKSVFQPRPGLLEPATVWQAKGDIAKETTGNTGHGILTKGRTDITIPSAPKGAVKIVIDREQNNDALEKSLRRIGNSQYKAMANVLERDDEIGVWTETTTEQQLNNEQMNKQLTSSMPRKRNQKAMETETMRNLKKDGIYNSTQCIDKTLGTQHIQNCKMKNNHQKTEASHSRAPKNTTNAKLSIENQNFTCSPSQHPVNQPAGEKYEVTRDFQNHTLFKRENQYSNADTKKNNMNLRPLPVDQDISNVTEVKTGRKHYNKFKVTDKEYKTDVHLESQDFLMKTNTSKELKMAMERSFNPINLNLENNVKESEGSLPPPSPPPPPPSNASSEIEFPLPPPPPLMLLHERNEFPPSSSTEKIRTDFESFPGLPLPPPPPVGEKSESECISMLPPPPPSLAPSQSAHPLSTSVPEKQSEAFMHRYSPEEASRSQQTHSQAKITRKKSPPPTLPKPKLPKQLEEKMNYLSSKVESESSLSDMQSKTTLSENQKQTMMATGWEHRETNQEVLRKSLDERKQLSIDSVKPLSQSVLTSSVVKGKEAAPLIKSHSFPSSSEQQSPKPYVRKFKTPLMIAEEKYKQQRNELEKQRQENSHYNIVKAESQNQSVSELEKEMRIKTTNKEDSLARMDAELPMVKFNPDSQSNAAVLDIRSDSQHSMTSAVTAATKKLQDVLAASKDKSNMKKEVLQSSRDIVQLNSACEINQVQQEHWAQQTQQEKYQKEFHLSQCKAVSPSFKVKTIKLPTPLNETDHSFGSCIKQSEVEAQTTTKQLHQETKKTQTSAEYKNESVAEKYRQLPKKEKRMTVSVPTKYAEKCHDSNLQKTAEMTSEFRQSVREKLPGDKENNQVLSMMSLNEQRLIDERQQICLKKKSEPKVVQQQMTDIESQTRNFQQTQMQTSESTAEHNKLSTPYNTLQETKCVRGKDTPQKQVFSETKDSKQEITQNKSSFSSVKESQQEDGKAAINILEFLRKREEIQEVLSRIKQFEAEPNKNSLKTFQTLLNIIPSWLISEERRDHGIQMSMENNLEKIKEEIMYIKTQAEDRLVSCEDIIQSAMMASKSGKQETRRHKPTSLNDTSFKVLSVNANSNINRKQKEHKIIEEKIAHHQVETHHEAIAQDHVQKHQERKLENSKISPPSLKTPPPSPTFITIESTRRPETSSKEELSQASKKESCPEPSPRGSMVQTPGTQRANTSPSPPRSRSEQLVKLKDTTAKLSRGTIPGPPVTPVPIVEKRSEIVMSPATLRRQIKIEKRGGDSPPTITIPVHVNPVGSGSFRESVGAQEEVRRVQQREMYVHKDGVNAGDSLMPDSQSYDAVEIIRRVEGPRLSEHTQRYEAANRTVQRAENFVKGHENEMDRWFREFENGPVFEAKSEKRVYANGDAHHNRQQEGRAFCKDEFESLRNHHFAGFAYKQPRERQETVSVQQPRVCSDTRSVSERFSGIQAFESQTVGSMTASSSLRSEAGKSALDFKHAPPTYEDVIAGHILDIADSPKERRRDFQETWQESGRVFESLGYKASDVSTTEMRSTFQESAFISETASPRQGNMYTLSKDSLSNGVPSSRQAEFS
ncbi:xin actin-binding repeat-containing protein 2 [Dipodomys spectabilis]|uniref:xin actin-binding repeat-containing protein 2 n=1 Tax=Dipodomys spectabilis TaxID=105255 RepID=UPI001C547049|nr:xin actin-binding repeat-containing protein 2 [Dipodomys spectabilis]